MSMWNALKITTERYDVFMSKVYPKLSPQLRSKVEECRKIFQKYREGLLFLSLVAACGEKYLREGMDAAIRCAEDMFRDCREYFKCHESYLKYGTLEYC